MSEIEVKLANRLSIEDVVNVGAASSEEPSHNLAKSYKSAEQSRFMSFRNSRVILSPSKIAIVQ